MLFVVDCVMLHGLFVCVMFNVCVIVRALVVFVCYVCDLLCDVVWCVLYVLSCVCVCLCALLCMCGLFVI